MAATAPASIIPPILQGDTVDFYELQDKKIEEVEHLEDNSNGISHDLPQSKFATIGQAAALRLFWKAILFSFMCSFAATSDGFANSLTGSIIANQGFVRQFGQANAAGVYTLDTNHVAAWGGMLSGGTIIAVFGGAFTADKFGRKFNLWALTGFLLIGNILEIVAKEWRLWLVAKLFVGMGLGLGNTVCVVYVAEIAPPAIRGFLIATWPLAYGFGQLFSAIGLQVLETSSHREDYKRGLYSQFAFVGVLMCFLAVMPESPWWYGLHGKHEQAEKALRRINGNVKGYDAAYECKSLVLEIDYSCLRAEIDASLKMAAESKQSKWTELFRGSNGRRSMVSGSITCYAQIAGGAVIFNYLAYFFSLAGMADPFLANLIVFSLLIVFVCVAFFTTDRIGRRPLMIGGCSVLVICLLGVGVSGTVKRTTATSNALIGLACIWVVAYASFVSPLAVIFSGEIATPRLRAKTNSLGQGAAQLLGLVFNYSVPHMLAVWNVKTGYFFACTAAIGFGVLFFILPETKGRTFSELDELFLAGVPARRFKGYRTRLDEAREGNV